MIELDGSQGEGGGQILRTALALSVVTGQPMGIDRIRAKRPKPGLMRQHLACVQAAQAISGAQVTGAELGSQQLRFAPGPVRAGDYTFSIASAGSAMLVLQTVLPPLLLADAPSDITLTGGTHNPMAPCFHFLRDAYAPLLARLAAGQPAPLALTLKRHGFYPAGGGQVQVHITPPAQPLQAFDLMARGAPRSAHAEALSPGLPRTVATRELQALAQAMGWAPEQQRYGSARQDEGPGNALIATLAHEHVTEVFTEYGARGVSAEEVAARLTTQLRDYQRSVGDDGGGAALGPHLADQWALLLALAVWQRGGQARFTCSEVTEHLRTNTEVIARFLPLAWSIAQGGAVAEVLVRRRV
ncbi:RNA 3'-terminal phosphate cyclase [Ottowia testudinis]|uniref:RNA 3'-terminal phosphate cyclase n=1 Tax=Ottowia testudinis TaxID=2816950 RepID=A0A975CJG8_9BURK|nr:RNA 3'-terminal phosphate cyclase [Ottowia testudinis]QTD45314.1 RNA 3'-terminal phosphate cyclase [Ottowia testudinis]